MANDSRASGDAGWRKVLRQGDPLTLDADLTAHDSRRLRARVMVAADLEASRELPALSWLHSYRTPILAASAILLVVVVTIAISSRSAAPIRSAGSPGTPAAVSAGGSAQGIVGRSEAHAVPQPQPEHGERPTPTGMPRSRPISTAAPAVAKQAPASQGESDRPRQLQFTTPGGTRIVWVLDPNFNLRPDAPQQEDPRWSAE